jgi:hypothetical protein
MTANDTDSKQWDDHVEARSDVIHQYGDLWRQAIAKSGVSDETATEALLQVCAACYLDGVNKGSSLAIAILVEEQLIREQAAILRSKNAALTNDEAYDLARAAVKMKGEQRSE